MKGLRSLFSPATEERAIDISQYAHLWNENYGIGYTPVPVGVSQALTNAASSACIDTLATSLSALPVDVIRQSERSRVEVNPVPALIGKPSMLVERDVWMYQLMFSLLTDGNAFGEIVAYRGTYPTGIELYDPATVTDRRLVDGKPTVLIGGERRALYPFGDVWHVPGPFPRPGTPFADSPITRARSTIGAAIAARDFGSRFFGDGGHPTGLLSSKTPIDAEQARQVKDAFRRATADSREPLVLQGDITYDQLSVDPSDSQFLDLQRFTTEEACRFWRVPPSMIYAATSGQNVTYANVAQADLAYLKHSLEGHLVRLETALTSLLPRPQFVRFNRDAFLRSDPETRARIEDMKLRNRTRAVNEVRRHEDEEPFADPAYDDPGIPGVVPASTPAPAPTTEVAPNA